MDKKSVSIIIPVLNEENYLKETLDYILSLSPTPLEIIAVDGGSSDKSLDILKEYRIKTFISGKTSRAIQMNRGAFQAKGEILVFIHADTTGPPDLVDRVSECLKTTDIILGGFISIMQGMKNRKFMSFLNYYKTYFWALILNPYRFLFKGLRILFGDQVMFCRKKNFEEAGGFNESFGILEDAELCLRMNKSGKVRQFQDKVFTSDRRVSHYGNIKALWIYSIIVIAWTIGFSPERLRRLYLDIR